MTYLARLKALNSKAHYTCEPSEPSKPPFDPFESSPPSRSLGITPPDSAADRLAERAAIVQEGTRIPADWAGGFAQLEARPAPRGVDPATWLAMMNAAGRFLDQWGSKAAAAGWTAAELFGLDPNAPMCRLDKRGAAFALIGREVIEITPTEITIMDGANVLRMRRRNGFTLAAWEATP